MKSVINLYDFILKFSTEDINEIRSDIELYFSGHQFIVASDTYDIISHFMPYAKPNFFENGHENSFAQRIIAYDSFFNSERLAKQILLMDEYKIELLAIRNILSAQLKNKNNSRENIAKLLEKSKKVIREEYMNSILNESEGILPTDFFETFKINFTKNFELITTLALLNENSSKILEKFYTFLNTKLKLFEIDIENLEEKNEIENIFFNTRASNVTKLIYEEFVNENQLFIGALENDHKRYNYLENTYRDIEVIDRLSQINIRCKELKSSKKIIFIYLSSAPTKTKNLFLTIRIKYIYYRK